MNVSYAYEAFFYAFILSFSINQNQSKMKTKFSILFLIVIVFSSCAKRVDYTPEFIEQASGRYLYSQDEVIDVYFQDNTLFLKWRGSEKIKPIVLDDNKFSVIEMNRMIHFVVHPKTNEKYLSKISESDENQVSYDFKKVSSTFKVPSMYLKEKNFEKALAGYKEIQKNDSTSIFINERAFNTYGYKLLSEENFKDAIEIFKINVALYPKSNNVYDSLGEAFLSDGDSLQAFKNYKQALKYNTGNRRAKRYIEAYKKRNDSL